MLDIVNKNFMALDLEMNQPSGTIIQVGTTIGNLKTGEVFRKDCYTIKVNEPLATSIVSLTGIQQKDVDSGMALIDAFTAIHYWFKKYDCFRNPITWGGGDSIELKQQLGIDSDNWLFGRRWIDTKTLHISTQFAAGKPHQAGLAKAMLKHGLVFKGRKHNAAEDSYNTFVLYQHLIKNMAGGKTK